MNFYSPLIISTVVKDIVFLAGIVVFLFYYFSKPPFSVSRPREMG